MAATVISLSQRRSPRPGTAPRLTSEEGDRALDAELRRAGIRIARLEARLADAVRATVACHERAQAAERRLADLTG